VADCEIDGIFDADWDSCDDIDIAVAVDVNTGDIGCVDDTDTIDDVDDTMIAKNKT